jgi:hypothetical protein
VKLGPAQTACRQNWGLAFYNDLGGVVLGKIWGQGRHDPNLGALPFPEGTVAVKLVFTEATPADDPKLTGAPELRASIHTANTPATTCAPAEGLTSNAAPAHHKPCAVQIDLAVRENRASYKTGWVYGGFRYDGTIPGNDPWARLTPLGLVWGNDPQLSDADAAAGAAPRQASSSQRARASAAAPHERRHPTNAPPPAPRATMAAQWPTVAPMIAPANWADAKCWFRNLDARYVRLSQEPARLRRSVSARKDPPARLLPPTHDRTPKLGVERTNPGSTPPAGGKLGAPPTS